MLGERTQDGEDDRDREDGDERLHDLWIGHRPAVGRPEDGEHPGCEQRSHEERGPAERLGAGEPLREPRGRNALFDDGERRPQPEGLPRLGEHEADEN